MTTSSHGVAPHPDTARHAGMAARSSGQRQACGERHERNHQADGDYGSSPRVRGTPQHAHFRQRRLRFIPARAGNAPVFAAAARVAPVHPRACGERGFPFFEALSVNGSSPRVRGTRAPLVKSEAWIRFIPARAGNASNLASRQQADTVHPRACGERSCGFKCRLPSSGSSPRVRGTL